MAQLSDSHSVRIKHKYVMSRHVELTNLLTPERARALLARYYGRFAVLALLTLSGLVVANGLFLLPSYIYTQGEVLSEQQRLSHLNDTLNKNEERSVNTRINSLRDTVQYLGTLTQVPSGSALIQAVLAVGRPGVILTGFTVTPAKAKNPSRMTVSGVAASRDALRAYNIALGKLPFVSNADLPISAYAKESNIPFTITLTGSLIQ